MHIYIGVYTKACIYSSGAARHIFLNQEKKKKKGGDGDDKRRRRTKQRGEEEHRGEEASNAASFITNLFHPVVEMGHCSLRALPKRDK